jgi:hypothetical protein
MLRIKQRRPLHSVLKNLLVCQLLLLFALPSVGQNFPDGFNYQAVLRDGSGNLMAFQPMELKIGILSGSISGPLVYEETFNVNSDGQGAVQVVIGEGATTGNGQTNDFSTIDWAADDMFINLQVDENSSGTFTDFMTTQLYAVPYAMHAKTTDQIFALSELMDVDTAGLQSGYSLVWDGSNWVASPAALGVDTVPYANTAGYSNSADSANFAWNAQNVIPSDTALYTFLADSANYADVAGSALYADSASYADTAGYALNCLNGWNVDGNSLSGPEFLGSTNAEDLVFKTDNQERMRITSTGQVGIGTATPTTDFEIVANNGVLWTGTLNGGTNQTFTGTRMLWYPRRAHFYAGGGNLNLNDTYMGLYSMAVGYNTTARADYSFAQGYASSSRGEASFAGGLSSITHADYSFAYGQNSRTYGEASVALGRGAFGDGNTSVALGYHPHAYGDFSVAMGYQCEATDTSSFALGYRAHSDHVGAFVISDKSNASVGLYSDGDNKFMTRFAGGTEFYTSADLSTGVILAAGGGAWATVSDSTKKEHFETIDGQAVLRKLETLPVYSWNYKSQDDSIRHIGPMAQDLYAAFGYGESDTTITTTDIDGINLVALQALMIEFESLESEVNEYGDWQEEKAELLEDRALLLKRIERMESLMLRLQAQKANASTSAEQVSGK